MSDKGTAELWDFTQSHYCGVLDHVLTAAGRIRLLELVSEAGGLTPTEARPWFEPPAQNWKRVEAMLFVAFDRLEQHGGTVPKHLWRWMDDYRSKYIRPLLEQ